MTDPLTPPVAATAESRPGTPGQTLRIAAHNGAPEWGGAEVAVVRLLADLAERGHETRLWCGRSRVARRAAQRGIDTAPLALGGDIALHHALRVWRAAGTWRPDVVIGGTFRKLLHLSNGARLARVPLVARIGLSTDLPRNAKYRWLFTHHIAHTVVNSHDLRDAWLAALPELDPGRISVIYKGVTPPSDLPSRAEARRSLGLDPEAVVVGAVGRLVEQKRFDRWLHVLADLPRHVQGVLVGEGPLRARLHERAGQLGVAERVRFTGYLEAPWRALPAFDVLLVTSDRESMANVMLEALAAGVPTVSTPVDGAREALHGATDDAGWVSPDFEPSSLTAALAPLLANRERLLGMAERARQLHAARFTAESSAAAWESVLRAVAISGRRAPPTAR